MPSYNAGIATIRHVTLNVPVQLSASTRSCCSGFDYLRDHCFIKYSIQIPLLSLSHQPHDQLCPPSNSVSRSMYFVLIAIFFPKFEIR